MKSNSLAKAYEYFTTNEWVFKSSNMLDIIRNLDSNDQQVLLVDTLNIDWRYIFCLYKAITINYIAMGYKNIY